MDDNTDNKPEGQMLGGMKIQTEKLAFEREDLVNCSACGKVNPPNRTSCLYCAAAIGPPAGMRGDVKLNLRRLENWENGYNLVFVPPPDGEPDARTLARLINADTDVVEKMLRTASPLPIARLESQNDALLAAERAGEIGLRTRVVNDIDLKIGKPAVRLRSIEFQGEAVKLTAFNTGEESSIAFSEIALIVVGMIVESRVESVEKGRKEKRKVLAESSTSRDDILFDIYSGSSEQAWRVTTKGFDFSGLGAEKGLLAADNMRRLLSRLRTAAGNARTDEGYPELINVVSEVWDIEKRTDFEGMKRTGIMNAGFSSVQHTSNLDQFNKYSRLQRLLL